MPERGRKNLLRGHKGRSFLDAGMWLLDEDGGDPVYIPPTIRSAVDQLADLAQDQVKPPGEKGRRDSNSRLPDLPNPALTRPVGLEPTTIGSTLRQL